MNIRPIDPDADAAAIVELIRRSSPLAVMGVRSWRHHWDATPAHAERLALVAEVDGEVAATGLAIRDWFMGRSDRLRAYVVVGDEHRRRGIGQAVWERVYDHAFGLGVTSVLSNFTESEAGVRFAEVRGFVRERVEVLSSVDPREVTAELPPAVDVRPVAEVPIEEVYAVDAEATRDVPATGDIDIMPFDEWRTFLWDAPSFGRDGSFAVVADGRVVSVTLLWVDDRHERANNAVTGTLREYRGRGYAFAAKVASLRWAAANGFTVVGTANDERNAPMLAINRRLGYRQTARNVEYVAERSSLVRDVQFHHS